MPLPRSIRLLALAIIATLALTTGAVAQAPSLDLSVTGSPLISGRASARITATLRFEEPVDDIDLRVVDFDGRLVKQLASGPRRAGSIQRAWNGRDRDGDRVPTGAYRVVATATSAGETTREQAWVTVADRRVYPRAPGLITVVVDPGHGGSFDGAVGRDGTREADINLDIGTRLARMLEGAGIDVVMTRTTDANVNEPPMDLAGDPEIDITDDLAARTDVANRARADLFIAVHNNTAVNRSVGGPSTFYSDARPFTDRSARLARLIQAAVTDKLRRFEDDAWSPYDHGALIYPYYVLRGFDPPRLQRPTQMPGVLSEGLFLSNPRELDMLKRAPVRQAIADAYYEAIARYLGGRESHVGYVLVDGPSEVVAGDEVEFQVEIRNQGNRPMSGWRLHVGVVPAPATYEGRGRAGATVGSKRIGRLLPGRSVGRTIRVTAPDEAGDWLLIFDARDRGGARASRIGSPPLQVPLTTIELPSPEPSASSEPSAPSDEALAP